MHHGLKYEYKQHFMAFVHSREFENGTVVYNPMGNKTVTVVFAETRTSAASGKSSKEHVLKSPGGDIFLKPKAK